MKIVVTGGRAYANQSHVWGVLDDLHAQNPLSLLAHGGAGTVGPVTGRVLGADLLAGAWAVANDVEMRVFDIPKEDWTAYGRAAGPRRNRIMLDEVKPDLLVVFPGNRGTADCVRAAGERGVAVHRVAASST